MGDFKHKVTGSRYRQIEAYLANVCYICCSEHVHIFKNRDWIDLIRLLPPSALKVSHCRWCLLCMPSLCQLWT